MKNKDLNYIAGLEKAIKKKYGEIAIQNPSSMWNEDKEKAYLDQLKKFIEKQDRNSLQDMSENVDGVFITKKLLIKDNKFSCSVCYNLVNRINDDIYIIKYDCCEGCYIQFVEGREERWLEGWRPENVKKST
jgi:hypothetical protein